MARCVAAGPLPPAQQPRSRAETLRRVQVVYGFDVLKLVSEQGNTNGEPKQPVIITLGGGIPSGTPPRDFLKKLELPEDPEAHGYNKKVMRYSSTYRHTGLIGH